MLSGHGFELSDLNPFNYDYSLSYIDDNLETVFVDTPVAVAKGVANASVTTYDFFKTVTSSDFWNYYIDEPSRVVDAYKYVIDEHPALAATLAAIPAAALAVIAAITAPFTVTIAELGALGAVIFGGAAANAGCSIRSATVSARGGNGEYSFTANAECTDNDINTFFRWKHFCQDMNHGHLTILSEVSERGRCDLRATCEEYAGTPEEWCGAQIPAIKPFYPIFEVTGHCFPGMIPARKDAIHWFFKSLAEEWLVGRYGGDDSLSCLIGAGFTGIEDFQNTPGSIEIDTDSFAIPRITYALDNGVTIQIDISNVADRMSCDRDSYAQPNNMYTCSADISSAVYTCTNVQ